MASVVADPVLAEADVPTVDSVIVRQPSYFAALDALMAEIPVADWATWARARTLDEAASLLPQAYVDARFDFRADQAGTIKLLEVNPNPGWCWDGHLAKMAALEGHDYPTMLRLILQAAEERIRRTGQSH